MTWGVPDETAATENETFIVLQKRLISSGGNPAIVMITGHGGRPYGCRPRTIPVRPRSTRWKGSTASYDYTTVHSTVSGAVKLASNHYKSGAGTVGAQHHHLLFRPQGGLPDCDACGPQGQAHVYNREPRDWRLLARQPDLVGELASTDADRLSAGLLRGASRDQPAPAGDLTTAARHR